MTEAKPLLEFHYTHFEGGMESNTQKNAFARETILEISRNDDPIFRELMIKELAEVTKFREENLYEKLSILLNRNSNRKPKTPIAKTETIIKINKSRRDKIEQQLIQLCFVKDSKIRNLLYQNVQQEWFKNTNYKHIFDKVFIHLHGEEIPNANIIMDQLDELDRASLSELIFEIDEKNPSVKLAIDCIIGLETFDINSKLNQKRDELKLNPTPEKLTKILNEIANYQEQRTQIKTKYVEQDL